ncbi:MAG TPA: peptidylprolyl isomerase [Thermoanaerobaculia bacterium]|nr:peptidylprolyl isomerase [Thermoanaerobaculia bacterium]
MQIGFGLLALGLLALALPAAGQKDTGGERPRVALETSKGTIVLELYPDKTPKTVENFLAYVESGFFDGTLFHRVIDGFMIQGGGYGPGLARRETRAPIVNEAASGLSNERGTVAMARTNDPNSATSQFFISTADNSRLDYQSPGNPGYTAFARVVEGMDVVDAIAKVETGPGGQPGFQDVPVEPVVIRKASVVAGAG